MSANDYKVCFSWRQIYLAKVSKRDPNLMLKDRRPISESEILGAVEWYAREFCIKHKTDEVCIFKDDKEIFRIKICGDLLEEVKKEIKED